MAFYQRGRLNPLLAGITKKTVAEWEQGRQEPSHRRYIQLAKMAEGEQALWFLERIGLDRNFLGRVSGLIADTA